MGNGAPPGCALSSLGDGTNPSGGVATNILRGPRANLVSKFRKEQPRRWVGVRREASVSGSNVSPTDSHDARGHRSAVAAAHGAGVRDLGDAAAGEAAFPAALAAR